MISTIFLVVFNRILNIIIRSKRAHFGKTNDSRFFWENPTFADLLRPIYVSFCGVPSKITKTLRKFWKKCRKIGVFDPKKCKFDIFSSPNTILKHNTCVCGKHHLYNEKTLCFLELYNYQVSKTWCGMVCYQKKPWLAYIWEQNVK